ncbi:MAG: hypothetical protein JJE25_11785, partial [Bacteroidia bacterium]|nr:hypothetical protein [Bacteroidia bacterium]
MRESFLPKNFSLEKASLWFVFLFLIGLTFFNSNIPFFWDGDLLSREAHFYFENNFPGFILPADLDRDGTPVLYAVYLAAIWKLFGKTLLISHLALLPFLLGIAWEYFKLAKKFLNASMISFAMLLLVFEPTFVTQSVIMGFDILMLYFFLVSLNALLLSNKIVYSLSLSLLGLCGIRGIILAVSLLIIHAALRLLIDRKIKYKESLWYAFPIIIFACITFTHYNKTGWFFISTSPDYVH